MAPTSKIAEWVLDAWKEIPEMEYSLKKRCITNALEGTEDDILWEDAVADADSSKSDAGKTDTESEEISDSDPDSA